MKTFRCLGSTILMSRSQPVWGHRIRIGIGILFLIFIRLEAANLFGDYICIHSEAFFLKNVAYK